jgi:class 3 adenylate cyclase/ketosteroid isomerase-like protein/tetratricopeptide (TPR) repeat protein
MSDHACAACGAANEADARFCESCGAALQRSCGACGVAAASTTARFCRSCGASLDDPGAQPVSGPTRKTVTVLFADLAGSTAFEELVDPETAREVIGQYHELLRSTAQRHRAGVTKYIGDGFMAVWGVPEIGAGDAGHAVDAAVELQERFVGLATRLAEVHRVELALRVAVNTGEVVVGTADADLVGDALNVGARLESECPHGHVVVGEETWRSTRGQHRYDARGAVQVKGRTAAVPVYQWVGRADAADSVPFVGRSTELGRLHTVFDDAVATRTARLVTIAGDPGVGKTRLAAEFIGALGDSVRVIRAHCAVEGSPAMTPLVDVLRTRDLDVDIPEHAAERDRILRDLSGMTAGVAGSVEEAFWALRRYVEVLAADSPLVILVDDIQWADTLLVDFVEHIVEWVRNAPVLLIALARPELRETRPDLVTVGGWVAEALRLRGLEAHATAELAARVLGSDRLPEELLDRLPSSTGGNPLFVRELVGMLVHDGVLVAKPGGWSLTVDVDAISVPPTIQALLASRLERLSPANRRVLEVASVIGTDFSPSAVAALAGVGEAETMSALNRLRRLDLAQPSGAYAGDVPVWRFHHVLIRDVAYRRLLKSERADLHERLANWVHAGGASVAFESDEVIARNLEAAHGYRCDLGLRDGQTSELALRSARSYLASARRALDRDELGSAGSQAARGASLADTDSALHAELLLVGCEAFLSAGDVAAGAPLVDALESNAGQALAPWTTCYQCQLVVYTDPTRLLEVDGRLTDAIEEFSQREDAAGLAKAHRVRAGARARLGRIGDCEADLFEALIAARQCGDHRQITAALGAAPNAALWGPSPAPKAGGRCLDVVRMQRMTTAAPSLEATSLRCLAVLELLRGRPDKARSMLADARQIVADLGLRHGLMETELFAGIIELMAGEPAAAEPHLQVALEGLGALGVGADAGQAAALLARSILAQGRLDEADRYAAESERIAGHNLKTAIAWRSARAEILSAQGQHDAAVTMARDAVAVAAGTDLVLDHAEACLALSRIQAAAGDDRGSVAAQRDAETLYAAKDAVFMIGRTTEPAVSDTAPPQSGIDTTARLAVANRASRIVDVGRKAMESSDLEALIALYADRIIYDDHRWLSGDPVGSIDELRAAAQRHIAQYPHVEWRSLAVRGESLALASDRWSDDSGNQTTTFNVIEIGDDELISYHGRFDEDDFESAYRELERRYYAGEGARFATSARASSGWVDAIIRRDIDTARALSHPGFRWVAPPTGLKPIERSVDDMFEWMNARGRQVASQRHWVPVLRWLSPTCSIGIGEILGAGVDGEEYRWNFLFVGECVDGLLASTREFGVDDEDAAFAYAESLITQRPSRFSIANRASETGDAMIAAMQAGDIDAVLGFWADRFVYADHRRLGGDPIQETSELRAAVGRIFQQYSHFEAHNLAVRGNNVYLGRSSWSDDAGNEARYVGVYGLDADGLVCYHSRFDEDDFWAAYRDMEARYYAGEGAQFATNGVPASSWTIGIGQDDIEAVRRVSDSEFRWHAPPSAFKARERSVDDMFAWMRERRNQVSTLRHWNPAVQWLSPTCCVALGEIQATGADGEDFRWHLLIVIECQEGLVKWVREFSVADEDDAFAYAEALAAHGTSRLGLTNRASEAGDRVIAAMQSGDVDAAVAQYSDDVVYDDRRRLSGDPIVGIAAVRTGFERLSEQYTRFALRTWAVRGDTLHLGRGCWSDEAGNQSTVLLLGEIEDDGRIIYHGTFDEEDFEGAYRTLDARYYAAEGAAFADAGTTLTNFVTAGNRGELDTAFRMLDDPGLHIESRSRSIFPGRDAAELREGIDELFSMVSSVRWWYSALCWISPDCGVARQEREAIGPDGETYSWATLYAGEFRGDVMRWVCEFEVEDEDAAFAYAEEHMQASKSRLPVTNSASAVGDRTIAALQAGDFDTLVSLYSEAIVYDDRRRLGGDAIVGSAGVRAASERLRGQYSRFTLRTLAVRGDTLSLAQASRSDDAGNQSIIFMVGEIDDDGRVVYQGTFDEDDFNGAYSELERRYYSGPGESHAAAGAPFTEQILAENSGDLDRTFSMFATPGLQIESRSRSVFPRRSPAELRRSVEELGAMVAKYRVWASTICWVSDDVTVSRHEREAVGRDGETYAWSRLYVAQATRDGQFTAICEFDIDDEESAFEYAEDLARASTSRLAVANRASELTENLLGALHAGDIDGAVRAYSNALVYDDRRSLSGNPITDIDDTRAAIARICMQYSSFEGRSLAIRGETLELGLARVLDDAGNQTSGLVLIELDADGHIGYEGRFDEDDFENAYRELERRYYAGEGAASAEAGTRLADFVTLINRGDVETVVNEFLSPGLYIENRSRSLFPDRTPAELRRELDELSTLTSATRMWAATICWSSATVFVTRLEREATGAEGEQYAWTHIYVADIRDGRIQSAREFDIEAEAAAFRFAEELSRIGSSRLAVANRASTVFDELARAMTAGDARAAVESVGDHYVLHDRRRVSGDPVQGKEYAHIALKRILQQFSRFEHRVLAARGENLVLYWSRWSDASGNETAYLHLVELGEGGLIGDEVRFDPDDFEGAYGELEERYYAGEGAAAAGSGLANASLVAAMNRADFDTMFGEFIWPDLHIENRSRSGFPDRSADELRASFVELHKMVGWVRSWLPAIRWLSPDIFVGRLYREGVGHDGERFLWDRILVGVSREGRIATLCDFDAEDEDGAFAYAHEML